MAPHFAGPVRAPQNINLQASIINQLKVEMYNNIKYNISKPQLVRLEITLSEPLQCPPSVQLIRLLVNGFTELAYQPQNQSAFCDCNCQCMHGAKSRGIGS